MKPMSRREAIERGGRLVLGAATSCLLPGFASGCSNQGVDPETIAHLLKNTENARLRDIKLTVIYDNVGFKKGLRTDWGFACLVAGGFHLMRDDDASVHKKAARMKELGVRYVAPTHCTGGAAREIFAEVYGDRFLDSGTGRVIAGVELS